MTVTAPAPASAPPAAPTAPPPEAPPPGRDRFGTGRRVVAALLAVLVVVIAFAVYLYGLSALSYHRTQTTMYRTLQHQLAFARAPISATGEGKPMAILDIPEIGVDGAVVVEGSSARDLTRGPGHVRSTAYPGQAGTSVIYGRRTLFGAPFRDLLRLQVGQKIEVTTGQGIATYTVSAFGEEGHPPPVNSANRLWLVTSDSSWAPHRYVTVSADLTSPVQPTAGPAVPIQPTERGLTGDVAGSLVPLLLWSQALLLVAVGGTLAWYGWARWPAFAVAAPVGAAVLWCVFENAATMLPNLY